MSGFSPRSVGMYAFQNGPTLEDQTGTGKFGGSPTLGTQEPPWPIEHGFKKLTPVLLAVALSAAGVPNNGWARG